MNCRKYGKRFGKLCRAKMTQKAPNRLQQRIPAIFRNNCMCFIKEKTSMQISALLPYFFKKCHAIGMLQKQRSFAKKLELFHFYMRAVCQCMRNTPTNDIKRPFFLTFLVTLHWTFYTQEESFYSALTPFSSFRFLMWDILTEYRSK